jgi:queuine tRNA-ribosyltransferase
LVIAEEMLAPMLITLHNLRYFHRLMERMREAIVLDRFMDLRREVLSLRGEA